MHHPDAPRAHWIPPPPHTHTRRHPAAKIRSKNPRQAPTTTVVLNDFAPPPLPVTYIFDRVSISKARRQLRRLLRAHNAPIHDRKLKVRQERLTMLRRAR